MPNSYPILLPVGYSPPKTENAKTIAGLGGTNSGTQHLVNTIYWLVVARLTSNVQGTMYSMHLMWPLDGSRGFEQRKVPRGTQNPVSPK